MTYLYLRHSRGAAAVELLGRHSGGHLAALAGV
jgi:hypothetical protein